LKYLPEAEQLRLMGTTDAGLIALCNGEYSDGITQLSFHQCRITSHGLDQLSKLTNLRSIFFNTTAISDRDLASLQSVPALERLFFLEEIGGTRSGNPARFTEQGFAEIGRLNKLKYLQFNRLKISDEAARQLHRLTRLKILQIGYCQISDAAVAELRAALPDCRVRQYKLQIVDGQERDVLVE
jgi:hypothetical protein